MPTTKSTIPAKTKYAKLTSAKKSFCEGKTTKTNVKKVARAYVLDAVKKATKKAAAGNKITAAKKAKAEAEKKARKVLGAGCKMSAAIQGKKKAKAKAKPKAKAKARPKAKAKKSVRKTTTKRK